MRKEITLLAVAVAMSGALTAQAGEEDRTLRKRIKSVSSKMYVKSGRLELTLLPMTSMSLNDAFYQKFGGGLGIAYHFTESLSLGIVGTWSLNFPTSNAGLYGSQNEEIPFAGKRNLLVGLDLMWAPLYGKVSLAAEWIMHFDTYITGGIGAVGGWQLDQVRDEQSFGLAASFGLGVRLFASRTFAIKAELKDYVVFNDTVTFEGQEISDVQHQLLFNLGLCVFFLQGDTEE